jgi:hypothetical protein
MEPDPQMQPQIQPQMQDGGFLGFGGNSFKGVIKKTKSSESTLINNYENMEYATKKYNKAYKTHLNNLEKLDDYANFNGMENLFKKVILKDNFREGHVDRSNPLLFRNYRIMEEPAPSAFRREHILRQVEYVLKTSFAGREQDLIKHMSVDIGKTEYVLNITTIENVKKSKKLHHNGYVIEFGEARAYLKEVLTSVKKNLQRHSRLVEVGSRSSSRRSAKKSTKKSGLNLLSLSKSGNKLRSRSGKKTSKSKHKNDSRTRTKLRYRSNENNSTVLLNNTSRQSIKDISNKLSSKLDLPSMKDVKTAKITKPSFFTRPTEKKAKDAVIALPTSTTPFTTPLPPPIGGPVPIAGTVADKTAAILGTPVGSFGAPPPPAVATPPNGAPPPYGAPPYGAPQYGEPRKPRCKENLDQGSCMNNPECRWDMYYNQCKFNGLRPPVGIAGLPPPQLGFAGTPAGYAPPPLSPAPTIPLNFDTPAPAPRDV